MYITFELTQGPRHNFLDLAPFSTCTMRWKTESTDTSSRPAPRGQYIALIEDTTANLGRVKVSHVFVVFGKTVMTFFNNRVEQLGKDIVGLLVTCYNTYCSYKWMTGIVDAWKRTQA